MAVTEGDDVTLVHPAIAAYLLQENSRRIKYMEQKYGLKLQVQDDYHVHREDFRILSKRDMSEMIIGE